MHGMGCVIVTVTISVALEALQHLQPQTLLNTTGIIMMGACVNVYSLSSQS